MKYISKLLDEEFLQAEFPDIKVETHVSLPSTQDNLKLKLDKLNQPVLCLAEQQTAGRGRGLNRKWASPFATNIYLSTLYFSPKKLQELEGLSLVLGLSIVKTIKALGIEAKIKWPNDVFCHDKKIAGVLSEAFNNKEKGAKVIIGIGLNVNMDQNQEIDQVWTSLKNESGQYFDRNLIVVNLMKNLMLYFKKFEKDGIAPFLKDWQEHDYLYDKTVSFEAGNQPITGQVKGIDEKGRLLLLLDNHQTISI